MMLQYTGEGDELCSMLSSYQTSTSEDWGSVAGAVDTSEDWSSVLGVPVTTEDWGSV